MTQTSKEMTWPAIVAEAAAWIAMLHGPERSPAAERGLQRWLAEHPLHAKAFELATETWNETRGIVKRSAAVKLILPDERRRKWQPAAVAVACAAVIACVFIGGVFYSRQSGIETGIGERRVLTLEDGTQVTLNTATRLVVDYGQHRRHVRLQAGEALFEVAKRPDWPFVVSAGNRDITALGTAFLVRRDKGSIAVTLMEGRVVVAEQGAQNAIQPARELVPGERITYTHTARLPKVDRPELRKLTAWQSGKVSIDNLSLAQAVAELNRYSVVQIEVQGNDASTLRLSGIFRVGDSRNFANAVAGTYGLQIEQHRDRIALSGIPHSAGE